jgi:DNA-binding NtrC family response regulator
VECTKVLVVDQEQGAYETLKPGLSKHGYEVHTTTAVPQALALAGAHHYQAALVSLPMVCDTTLLPGLRAELPDLPVIIVLPSHGTDSIPTQVLEVAVNAIGKPLTLEPVRLILDRTLELATLRSQVRQHRQAWCDTLAHLHAPGVVQEQGEAPVMSFEVVLASKLRRLVPNLELLGRGSLYRAVLDHVEKLLLSVVLTQCRGNQVRAADILGINRNTLRKKIREFDISIPRGGG